MVDFTHINRALYAGKRDEVVTLVEQALADGSPPREVLQEGLVKGMKVVGDDFRDNVLYVPQVLIAARAMKMGMAILQPLLGASGESVAAGTIVLGTVKGDLHDIGKKLVCMLAEGAGFNVIDIGVDQTADSFVAAAKQHSANIVGASALLTTTMPYMKTLVDAFAAEELDGVSVCVGGAPVTTEFAAQIGAAGYAADAAHAVDLFESICQKRAGTGSSDQGGCGEVGEQHG